MNLYTYNAESNSVRKKAAMLHPHDISTLDSDDNYYDSYCDNYDNHLASLPEYLCYESCKGLWKDGDVLEEGKDFTIDEVRIEVQGTDKWQLGAMCVPLHPLQQTDTQDELTTWIKKIQPDYDHKESYQHGFFDALEIVKDKLQSFSITRKTKPNE